MKTRMCGLVLRSDGSNASGELINERHDIYIPCQCFDDSVQGHFFWRYSIKVRGDQGTVSKLVVHAYACHDSDPWVIGR
jgi:hypothetical protein